jgi:hypothetical protein
MSGKQKQVNLSIIDRIAVLTRIDAGASGGHVAEGYGISPGTVTDIKKSGARILVFCVPSDATTLSKTRLTTVLVPALPAQPTHQVLTLFDKQLVIQQLEAGVKCSEIMTAFDISSSVLLAIEMNKEEILEFCRNADDISALTKKHMPRKARVLLMVTENYEVVKRLENEKTPRMSRKSWTSAAQDQGHLNSDESVLKVSAVADNPRFQSRKK